MSASAWGVGYGVKAPGYRDGGARIRPFAGSPVSVIDSIVITKDTDTSNVLAEWIAYDPSITINAELTEAQAVRLFLNWSDRDGAIDLRQGDYFTFVVPDVFEHDYIANVSDVPITDELGEVVAVYSIYDNSSDMKEVMITFTDYAENHTDISGFFWMLLFVGSVDETERKTLEFVINDSLAAQGDVTVNPNQGRYTPRNNKIGFSSPTRSANGYYIFEWIVYFNMTENAVNGFHTLEGFTFEDVIPADSPHAFLTEEIRRELGLSQTEFLASIGEYTGADSAPPENRYLVFLSHYNNYDGDSWYDFIRWHTLAAGLTTAGINGDQGLSVADIGVSGKLFTASLGTITRPTAIRFYTASTIKITESALGDSEVVRLFKNTFKGSYGEELSASLTKFQFGAGGSAQGIIGEYGFAFTKVNESSAALSGAMFSLFTSADFSAGADRFTFSGADGVVAFSQLPEGTYYVRESAPPFGYLPNSTIYMVELDEYGFEIYYGADFENRLSDIGNRVINVTEQEVQPAVVILSGRKNLTGGSLVSGMFGFVVKDGQGNTVATGTNNADGSISFSSVEFSEPGVFALTVEEVRGTESGIIYDGAVFTVTVTVTGDGSGGLTAEVAYPSGGIVFNNQYVAAPVSVTLQGQKNLTGGALVSGMFGFVVKDSRGNTVATGTNNADGGIRFGAIGFFEPGVYVFTVEEVRGAESGIVYDGSVYTVTVTVTGDGDLTADVTYPGGGIVFNNRRVVTPETPCVCCVICRRSCREPRCIPAPKGIRLPEARNCVHARNGAADTRCFSGCAHPPRAHGR